MDNLFTIHDSAAGAFMRPFVAQSPGAAIRSFTDLVNDKTHPVGQHPEDYTLFHIGTFNQATGQLEGMAPHSLGLGVTYVTGDFPLTSMEPSHAESA